MTLPPLQPDWGPFRLVPRGQHAEPPRSIRTREGVADRLRAAAFAEIQARDGFRWAAEQFQDAPEALRSAWIGLSKEEEKHLGWLLARLEALGFGISDRAVSDHLWHSFLACKTAEEFARFMANAEERGRVAGERFESDLRESDPESARIFGTIALEERSHIELARKFFPDKERSAT